jgi:SAM-dependent methyltransferase
LELSIFEKADNWKAYWGAFVRPYLRGDVADVGAGLGANTSRFADVAVRRWLCLEPDADLAGKLREKASGWSGREVRCGTIAALSTQERFDAILYIDVLEHIEEDRAELAAAASHLRPGGALIVLSPAHMWLYSEFDAAIGHFRRYTRASLRAISPEGARLERLLFLDCAGILASLANRAALRRSTPSARMILTWDRFLVPWSRRLDGWFRFKFGKSLLAVWTRTDE